MAQNLSEEILVCQDLCYSTFTLPFIGLGEQEYCPRGELVWKLCFHSEGISSDTLKSLFFH